MAQLFRNNAFSNLGASLTNVATTLTVTTGHGDRFPVVAAPDFCLLTLQDASNNIEIVKVTARTAGADSMTIERAQEDTTARSWNLGDAVELRLTAGGLAGASVATATKLQTARTLTVGNTGKSFDGSADVSWSLAEILGGGALSFRNKLINAAFTVNQRGYASGGATTAANQYTLDRWRVVASGQALSWSGTAPNITITAPAGGVEQVIEGIWIEGGTYTISWTGTATATVNGSAVANGGQVTLTAGANATVRFSGGTVSKPQLELGSYATQFEHRPYGLELSLCQRYYYRIYGNAVMARIAIGRSATTTTCTGVVVFPVPMRSAPSAMEQSGTASDYGFEYLGAGQTSTTVPTLLVASTHNAQITGITLGSAISAGEPGNIYALANGYLGFSAEL